MNTQSLTGVNFIGQSPASGGSDTFQAVDPATGASLPGAFHKATPDEVVQACELACQAFDAYRRIDPYKRADFLEAMAAAIDEVGEELSARAGSEAGLSAGRLNAERGRTVGQIRMFASMIREGSWVGARIDRAIPDRQPLPKPDVRRMLVPIGPVVVFGASNFPLAFSTAGGDTASALAAGCPVIVKAHEAHPGTAELVARAVLDAAASTGMPDGVFSMLHGGPEVGMALVCHPAIAAVGFTGSLPVGRAVFNAASSRPKPIPVYAEMGSSNPVFLLPGALKERGKAIAQGLQQAVTLGVGQFCTNPGLVMVQEGESLATFTAELGNTFQRAPHGTMLHGKIRDNYERGVARCLEVDGVATIARAGGDIDAGKTQCQAIAMTTSAATFLAREELGCEIFGPSTLVVRCGSAAEMLTIARELEGHLTATIHGTEKDLEGNAELLSILQTKVGRIVFNGFPTGVEVCASMQHGGPYPATTDSRTTSVGGAAIERFARPVAFQGLPQKALPAELRDANERKILRLVDNEWEEQ